MHTLSEIAEYFYDVAELYEDEDLDPEDHSEVLYRAFTSSHCDDFASVLSSLTGFPVVSVTWRIDGCGIGHHAVVRDNEGRYIDVAGYVTLNDLANRYSVGIGELKIIEGHVSQPIADDYEVEAISQLIQQLPHSPFSAPEFREVVSSSTAFSLQARTQPGPDPH